MEELSLWLFGKLQKWVGPKIRNPPLTNSELTGSGLDWYPTQTAYLRRISIGEPAEHLGELQKHVKCASTSVAVGQTTCKQRAPVSRAAGSLSPCFLQTEEVAALHTGPTSGRADGVRHLGCLG